MIIWFKGRGSSYRDCVGEKQRFIHIFSCQEEEENIRSPGSYIERFLKGVWPQGIYYCTGIFIIKYLVLTIEISSVSQIFSNSGNTFSLSTYVRTFFWSHENLNTIQYYYFIPFAFFIGSTSFSASVSILCFPHSLSPSSLELSDEYKSTANQKKTTMKIYKITWTIYQKNLKIAYMV